MILGQGTKAEADLLGLGELVPGTLYLLLI
jgi:hypothetical protein